MAVRITDEGESEWRSVMERISVASLHQLHRQHHRTRKRADFPLWCFTRENLANRLMTQSRRRQRKLLVRSHAQRRNGTPSTGMPSTATLAASKCVACTRRSKAEAPAFDPSNV